MSDLIAKMTASVLVIENERCLVLEEVDDDGTKKFNLPGGHIETGETPVAAAIREAKEELGCDVILDGLLLVQTLTWKQHNTVKFIFYGKRMDDRLQTEAGATAHWMDRAEIQSIAKDRWVRNMDEVLLLGLEGHRINPRAFMLYEQGKRV